MKIPRTISPLKAFLHGRLPAAPEAPCFQERLGRMFPSYCVSAWLNAGMLWCTGPSTRSGAGGLWMLLSPVWTAPQNGSVYMQSISWLSNKSPMVEGTTCTHWGCRLMMATMHPIPSSCTGQMLYPRRQPAPFYWCFLVQQGLTFRRHQN